MFKKIEKGFTIIELLAVVVIIGVIMVLIRPTIQNMIGNARYRAAQQSIKGYIREAELKSTTSNISVNGIKIGPTKFVFETGADEEDLAKIKINGKYPDYIYMEYNKEGEVIYGRFCINNYSMLYENNEVTDAEENYCTDEYTQTPIVSIDNTSVKTSRATVTFSVSNNYPITSTTCDYGETPLFGSTGNITNNACRMDRLEHNRIYYYRVCATNTKGRKGCRTDYLLTSNMNHPTIEYINTPSVEQNGYLKTQVLKVIYDRTNVENPEYYIKSTLKATTNNNVVSRCGMDTLPKNCTNQTTKEILPDNWYKVSGNINVTYDNNSVNQGSLTALLSDGVDYSASTTAIVSRIDNEAPTIALKDVQATSNTLRINYTLSDSKSGIKSYTCKWGTSNNNYNNTVTSANVTDSSCIITGLEVRKPYYYQICTTDNVNNNYCYTGSAETASIIAPQITITKTPNEDINGYLGKAIIKVFYSSVNVTNPEYYIRSNRVGIVPAGSITSSCGTSTMPGTCTNSTVTTLTPDTWYRVNRNIDITYDTDSTDEGSVTAYLSDGSQYSGAASINIPKIDKTNPTITLGNKVIKTNSITLNYVLNDSKTGIRDYTCKYGTSSNNYNISGASITSTSCLLNNLKENTTYYYQICTTDGVGNGPVCITGSDTTTSIINPTITYTNTPAGITYVAPVTGDTHKGILYFDPSNLNAKCDEDSTITNANTGCKKFYIYDDSNNTYKIIMDRNLGGTVAWVSKDDFIAAGGTEEEYGDYGNNSKGPITANKSMNERTINWIGNPRLITADEVAHIVGADREDTIKWSSSKTYANPVTDINTQIGYYYFDGKNSENPTSYSEINGWGKRYVDINNKSKYAWLYDYVGSCVDRGCNHAGSQGHSYWTSTTQKNMNAWFVHYNNNLYMGSVFSSTYSGIRPVLEIPKTLVTRNNYYKEQIANVTFISTNVENPIYYIKSTREGITNINVLQSCGTETLPQNCVSSSVKNIVANTWYKVSGNINVTYNTESNVESTLYALTYDGVNYGGGVGNTISKIDREVPTVRITNTTTTTNSAVIYYALDDTKSGIGTYTCKYSDTEGTYNINGINITNTSCTLPNLSNNKNYYYQVCVSDSVGNGPTCKEGNIKTNEFEPITISFTNTPSTDKSGYLQTQIASVNYNATNITNPMYYLKSTRNASISTSSIATCGTDTMPGTCTSNSVTSILANTWYKVSGDISVTYNEHSTSEAILYTALYDGYNFSRSTTSNIAKIDKNAPTYTVTPSSTTNSITLEYNPVDNNSGVGSITCKYSDTANTYTIDADIIEDNKCIINNLSNNKTYYYQVCITDLVGNEACSNNNIKTKEFTKPIINLINTPNEPINGYLRSQVAEVIYNSNNISNPTYYIKTTRAALASSSTLAQCGSGDTPNINNCTNDNRTTLSKDTWYKVTSTINVTYNSDATTEATIYAYTYDGNNLSGAETKTISKIEGNDVTPPIITGGSNDWKVSSVNISVSAPGTSTSGVKHYEYYLSTSDIKPDSTVTPTGTTSNIYTVTTEGINYVYYRTVSNAGNKSSWTDYEKVLIDTKAPSTPIVTYNNGTNSNVWQNNIDIKLSSTDTLPGSGISHYEVDTNNDSVSDYRTDENFVPTDGWNSNNTRFRAVDFAGKASSWSNSYNVLMDTTSPVLSNKSVTSLTYQNVTVEMTITDNASGIPDTPETYNGHRAGVYCVVSTSVGNYENWEWINGVKSNDKYICNIDPALFKHYESNHVIQIYAYDRAGNGGIMDRLNVVVPAKDYKATATCSSGTYKDGSCYFENNSNVCGCSEYNKTCSEYNKVCTEYNQVCSEWNNECSEYSYSCSVNSSEGYTCDTCTSSNMNEEVYCRKHTDNGFTYTTNTCSCTPSTCKTYTNTTCKTYSNGTCKTYENGTCKTYVDNLSSCNKAKSCYDEAYVIYSCPLGGVVVGDMCVRDTDTYTVTLDPNGGTISNGITTKNTAVGYKYGYLPTPVREGYTFAGWYDRYYDEINIDALPDTLTSYNYKVIASLAPGITYKINIGSAIVTEGSATQFTILVYDASNPTTASVTYNNFGNNIERTVQVPADWDSSHNIQLLFYSGKHGQTSDIGTKFTDVTISSLDGAAYSKDTISSVGKNHTLYAKWEPNTYIVTLDPNGGSVSTTTKEVTVGSTYGTLPEPTRDGYTFKGWNGKNLYNIGTVNNYFSYYNNIVVDGNSISCVKKSSSSTDFWRNDTNTYKSGTYTISADFSGNTGPRHIIFLYNENNELMDNTIVTVTDPYLTYNTFYKGWYTNHEKINFTIPSNVAYWKYGSAFTGSANTEGIISNIQIQEGSTATPYEPYYIKPDTTVVQPSAHTLTAIWEPNIYTVTYDSNGGSEINTSKQVTYGEAYGELPTPVKDGYVFKGWNVKNMATPISSDNYTFSHYNDKTSHEFREEDGVNYIRINGAATNVDTSWYIFSKNIVTIEANKSYVLSFDIRSKNAALSQLLQNTTNGAAGHTGITSKISGLPNYIFTKISTNMNFANDGNWHRVSATLEVISTTKSGYIVIGNDNPNLFGDGSYIDIANIQLEEGDTATPYVPYLITPSTNVSTNANHTLKAIYTSYCDTQGISTLKECLIRNDSKDTYTNAINTINSRTPNFDETVKDVSKSGLFVSDDDYTTNDETKTYYYRGVVNNNWVKFGDYLWRIIRINGDGSIRMMYSGLASSATHTASNANINKTTYRYGVYETYTKNTTDLYDSSKTVATTYTNGRFGNTYVGYMYNPSRIFMTYPNKEVSTSYKLSSFPTFTNIGATTQYYFFDSFNPTTDCDQSTTTDTGACTLKCRNKGVDGDTGVNCVKSTWPDLANAHTSTTGDGTTSTQYLYTGDYKYTCWGYASAKEVNNADGTTSVYISCPIVSEILGTYKDQPTYAKVKYHGLFPRDAETSNQNIKDSNAKVQVENWYATNILGKTDSNNNLLENYLVDSIFCNERINTDANAEWPLNKSDHFYYTYRRVASQRKPTFKCLNADGTFNTNDSFTLKTSGTDSTVTASGKGNNMLKYPVGLITWDETAFAGGRVGSSYTNDAYWLHTGAYYWTMSPSYFAAHNGLASVGYVLSTGCLNSSYTANALGLRPVVNLVSGTLYDGGAGVESDPYIVKLP